MKKIYFLSNEFDYSKMIASDAGPKYSANMLWEYDYLKNINRYADHVNIIDARITDVECQWLEGYILKNKDTIFLLTITDPFQEYCRPHWYYRFLFRVKHFGNVFFLSKYTPCEIVRELDQATARKKIVVIHYPFVDKFQIPVNLPHRIKKVLISGALESNLYPYRFKFHKIANGINPLNLFVRRNTQSMQHPDYPDIGRKLVHNIIGDRYINYLSQFVFMLITPSRCHLELLKYSECAYANCVPVGKIPASFSSNMREPFLELDFNSINKSIRHIFSIPMSELSQRSRQYYQAFEAERSPKLLNTKLDSFLEDVVNG